MNKKAAVAISPLREAIDEEINSAYFIGNRL
jgi:hypothetical protein